MSEKWIYLVRHGKPEFPEGKTVCLGSAELPLSGLGRMQSVLAGFALKEKLLPAGNAQEGETPSREEQVPISVFSSTLGRAEETADWLIASWPEGSFRLQRVEEFRETDNGEWDGLTFETIRERYPALYEARGENPDLLPPGAEPREKALSRFLRGLSAALRDSAGSLVIVTHSGVLQLFFRWLKEKGERVGYGSVSLLRYTGCPTPEGELSPEDFRVEEYGAQPRPSLTPALCRLLLSAYGTPERVMAHCAAVAREAEKLALLWGASSEEKERILAASLLHDIARTKKHHPEEGAALLTALGYPEIASLIRSHHDAACGERLDADAILYLADKLVLEDQPVSLKERFDASLAKCHTELERQKHEERRLAAERIAERLFTGPPCP